MTTKISCFLLDLIFPRYCLGCQQEGTWSCPKCNMLLAAIPSITRPLKISPLRQLIIASNYNHPLLRRLIAVHKYRFVEEIGEILSNLLAKKFAPLVKHTNPKNFVVVPIPLHPKRLRFRGFNQAEILTRKLASDLGMEVRTNILRRSRHTLPQVSLAALARRQNVRKAFLAAPTPQLKNKIVILVDDVYTTGSTLQAAARAILKNSKPAEIWGLVVAKG